MILQCNMCGRPFGQRYGKFKGLTANKHKGKDGTTMYLCEKCEIEILSDKEKSNGE